ncbi:uncharacterized protein LOC124129040 [Haliotis rufescens]|uniref:uncharacterized protein LOC124129040 n=1 Tax=Haliotis rufescens TaxID=6454 RepID=UPI00201EA042|nr:uncharacterized protein LOC124129040 [Haliotis rufescens]
MTMFGNGLFIVLLAVLAPSLGCHPGPDELPDKLQDLLTQLKEAKADFQCIFDVTNEQCPCQTPGDCFESDLEALNSTLCELINDLTALIEDQPMDCPPLEGCAALVGGCNWEHIDVVDPVGTILPSIETNYNVSGFTVCGDNETYYYIYYIYCSPPTVKELCLPLGTETVKLGPDDNSGKYTGIASWDDKLYVAIDDYNGTGDDVLVFLYKSCENQVDVIVNISCDAGTVRVFDWRVYFTNCKEIQCVNETGGDLQTKLKFSIDIKSFDVIDEERIVFIDDAGGVWIYDISTKCFKLLYCIPGKPCGDVKVNRCSSLIYLAYPGVSELDIFNSTTCEKVGTLPYTTSDASDCPYLGFEPACPTDDGGDETTTT